MIVFAAAIANFAVAYAEQIERDYQVTVKAVRDGRIEVQLEELIVVTCLSERHDFCHLIG